MCVGPHGARGFVLTTAFPHLAPHLSYIVTEIALRLLKSSRDRSTAPTSQIMVKIEVETAPVASVAAQTSLVARSSIPSAKILAYTTPSPSPVKAEPMSAAHVTASPKTPKGKAYPKASAESGSTASPKKRKFHDDVDAGDGDGSSGSGGGGDAGWGPEKRLKLFELYQVHSAVRWDDLARDVSRHCSMTMPGGRKTHV